MRSKGATAHELSKPETGGGAWRLPGKESNPHSTYSVIGRINSPLGI